MICRNCGVKLVKGLDKCPICGTKIEHEEIIEKEIKNNIENLELPVLKSEDNIIELDDTDSNLGDNNFEIELKEKEEDENFDKFEGIDNTEENDTKIEEETFSEDEVSLEKTRSISAIDDSQELDNLSLIDDINRQIENVNEEANEFVEEEISQEDNNEEVEIVQEKELEDSSISDLTTKESVVKRKKILMITGIIFLIVALIIAVGLYFYNRTDKKVVGDNYVEEMAKALDSYYNGGDIDEVIFVLEDVKKDPEKVKKVQAKTRTICDSWVLLYFDEKVSNRAEFDEISVKYKELLNGLHTYAIVKNNSLRIKALTDTDYDELLKQVDDIYSDSTIFFDALANYNNKDYNRAYYDFEKVEEDNKYYEKAISYKRKIVSDILEMMEKDIQKIENGMVDLTDNEKLQMYAHIESIIFEYNNVYVSVNLSDDSTYQEKLSIYTSKVSEYTEKVSSNGNLNDDQNNQEGNEENSDNNDNQELENQ